MEGEEQQKKRHKKKRRMICEAVENRVEIKRDRKGWTIEIKKDNKRSRVVTIEEKRREEKKRSKVVTIE